MTNNDDWIWGLLAIAGVGFCAWLGVEARKALEKNWAQNNKLGVFVSAGTMAGAQAGLAMSIRELLRALKIPSSTPHISRKKRNPVFLPYYEEYPA